MIRGELGWSIGPVTWWRRFFGAPAEIQVCTSRGRVGLRFGRPGEHRLFSEHYQGTNGIPVRFFYAFGGRLTLTLRDRGRDIPRPVPLLCRLGLHRSKWGGRGIPSFRRPGTRDDVQGFLCRRRGCSHVVRQVTWPRAVS